MRIASRLTPLALAVVLSLSACTGDEPVATPTGGVDGPSSAAPTPAPAPAPAPARAEHLRPSAPTTVLPEEDSTSLALAASRTFFASAPVVVLADAGDDAAILRATSAAVALGAPLLLTPSEGSAPEDARGSDNGEASDGDAPGQNGMHDELVRLGATGVLIFGDDLSPVADDDLVWVQAPAEDETLADLLDRTAEPPTIATHGGEVKSAVGLTRGTFTPIVLDPDEDEPEPAPGSEAAKPGASESTDAEADRADEVLPATELAESLNGVLALTTKSPAGLAATATAIAAGANPILSPGDPRAKSTMVKALSERDYEQVVGIGGAFEDAETLGWRISTASTGVELPGGGQLVFPGKRYVALYGTPSTTSLGVLGHQDVPATIDRAAEHARAYADLSKDKVVPALEIIATVASAHAGSDNNYSNELPADSLLPLVEAAHDAGQYVLLDLQPGRSSFLEQTKLYADLLEYPNVGLALDPEWNLGPDEVHLVQIGSATAKEVNEVVTWLADFTQERALPQKMLILHQFQTRMIQTVDEVDLSRSELAILIHADGQGPQGAKQATWRTLLANAPGIRWWGWKNFYEKDEPMLTPEQTAQVEPFPDFISYQ